MTNSPTSRLIRKTTALSQALFSSLPSKYHYFHTSTFARIISRELTENVYNLVLIDHAEMLWALDVLPKSMPVIHISHNIEHLLYEQYVTKYGGIMGIGSLLVRDALKYSEFEIKRARQVRNLITISFEDLKFWQSLGEGMNVMVLNPVFDYKKNRQRRSLQNDRLILGFLGNMGWWPNRDAIAWLTQNVLPCLRISFELHLFGKYSEQYCNGNNIIGHGFVDNIEDIWGKVDIMVNPIVSGAGVNVKVAESIYNKVPMLCTPLALKGLQLVPDDSVVILETPEHWVEFLNSMPALTKLVSCNDFPNACGFSFENHVRILQNYLGQLLV